MEYKPKHKAKLYSSPMKEWDEQIADLIVTVVCSIGFGAILGFSLFMWATDAEADTLDLMTVSHHFTDEHNYNEKNYGLFYKQHRDKTDYNLYGVYKNSEYRTSYILGFGRDYKVSENVTASLSAGIVTGYARGTLPFVLPSVTFYDSVTLIGAPIDGGVIALQFRIAKW